MVTGYSQKVQTPLNAPQPLRFAPADKLSFDPRRQLAEIFVAGFYDWLKYFSKSQPKLSAALEHSFRLAEFYVAVTDSQRIVAMAACPQGQPSLALDAKKMRDALGISRGTFAAKMLQKHLVENEYPFPLTADTGSIEFVATAPDAQGRGIAGQLIEYVIKNRPFQKYVLEVAQTNLRAVQLYTRLGFTEKARMPASKRSGVGSYLYLERPRSLLRKI